MNASIDFKEFAKRTAAELDACARKSRHFASKDFYADECAVSSAFGIMFELRKDGVIKDKVDEKIAKLVFEESSWFASTNSRPLSAQVWDEIYQKLASAVSFAKRGWFAEQTAIAV